MPDPVNTAPKPIVVSENAGVIDTLTALGRYIVVIIGSFGTLLALLKTRDIAAILDWVRGADGAAFIAAITTIVTMLYGLYKTRKRGAQIATVAADPAVPNRLAQIKE